MCRQTQLLLPQEDASCRMSQPDAKTLVPDASSQRLLDTCLCQVHIIASHTLLCLKATPLLCEPCLPACLPRHALQLQGLILCVTLCVVPRERRAGMAQVLMVQAVQKSLVDAASAIFSIAWQASVAIPQAAAPLVRATEYSALKPHMNHIVPVSDYLAWLSMPQRGPFKSVKPSKR